MTQVGIKKTIPASDLNFSKRMPDKKLAMAMVIKLPAIIRPIDEKPMV